MKWTTLEPLSEIIWSKMCRPVMTNVSWQQTVGLEFGLISEFWFWIGRENHLYNCDYKTIPNLEYILILDSCYLIKIWHLYSWLLSQTWHLMTASLFHCCHYILQHNPNFVVWLLNRVEKRFLGTESLTNQITQTLPTSHSGSRKLGCNLPQN